MDARVCATTDATIAMEQVQDGKGRLAGSRSESYTGRALCDSLLSAHQQ